MDRPPGLSVRLKLTLSYAGFLLAAGAVMFVAAWFAGRDPQTFAFVLRVVPDKVVSAAGVLIPGNHSFLLRAFAPHRLSKTIAQLQGGQLSNSRSRNQPTTAQRPSSRRATRSSPDTAPSPTPEAINEDTDITTGRRYAAVLLPCPEGMGYRPATA